MDYNFEKDMNMTISERIFERLRQLPMTQKEFAKKAGIQQSTISEWKKNKTNPSSDKILAICKALDVSPEWLLSGVDTAFYCEENQEYYKPYRIFIQSVR